MIIAAFQGPVQFGGPDANLKTTIKALEEAESQGAEILAMPETFLHGYFKTEADARKNAVDLEGKYFRSVLDRIKKYKPTLLLGLNELRNGELFNTVVVIEQGKVVGRYSKNFLVFNYFKRGHEFPIFEKRGIKYGIVICADTSYTEPARILAMKGAQLIFTPHFNFIGYAGVDDHTWRVRQHHIAMAIDNDVFIARTNVVVPESQGTPMFGYKGIGVGDSLILNRRGRVLTEAGLHGEKLLIQNIPDSELAEKKYRPWHRVDAVLADALHDEYQKMFAAHANLDDSEVGQIS